VALGEASLGRALPGLVSDNIHCICVMWCVIREGERGRRGAVWSEWVKAHHPPSEGTERPAPGTWSLLGPCGLIFVKFTQLLIIGETGGWSPTVALGHNDVRPFGRYFQFTFHLLFTYKGIQHHTPGIWEHTQAPDTGLLSRPGTRPPQEVARTLASDQTLHSRTPNRRTQAPTSIRTWGDGRRRKRTRRKRSD
jgi:hypothetical protein